MKFLKFLFKFILPGIAFVSFIPHLFPNFWLTDIFSHFKLQYVILLILLLLICFFQIKKRIIPVALILVLLVWNSWFIVPLYLPNLDVTETSEEKISILSMNLLASNMKYSEALDLIRKKDPDVLVLLELSPQWEKEMQVLFREYPFQKMVSQTDNFGIGILSKIPIISTVTNFGKGFPPSILCKLEIDAQPLHILATHPVPPVGQEMFNFRNQQLEEIAQFSAKQTGAFILVGDLNTSSYSTHFQKLLEKGELRDSRKDFGINSSWPTDYQILRTTLDHFLIKGDLKVFNRSTESNIGSDHLPVFLEAGF